MRIYRFSEENFLRNNSFIIFAAKDEGMSFSAMDVFEYKDGLLRLLRDRGYKIFFGYKGSFVIDDFLLSPNDSIRIDIDEYMEIEKALLRTNSKLGRI